MHVYSFYLQVNLYKRGFSFERWGSPPSDFVLPFPHFSFVVANKDDIIYAHDCSDFSCTNFNFDFYKNEGHLPEGEHIYLCIQVNLYKYL